MFGGSVLASDIKCSHVQGEWPGGIGLSFPKKRPSPLSMAETMLPSAWQGAALGSIVSCHGGHGKDYQKWVLFLVY